MTKAYNEKVPVEDDTIRYFAYKVVMVTPLCTPETLRFFLDVEVELNVCDFLNVGGIVI